MCKQNRHIFNANLCAQNLAHISTRFYGREVVLPPYLFPNPIWPESSICGPFGCIGVPIRQKTNRIQKVCGTLLYYAIDINNTILPALSEISSDQYKATENTAKQAAKLLNYLASNPNAEIQYRASGMQLSIHSGASYLSVSRI